MSFQPAKKKKGTEPTKKKHMPRRFVCRVCRVVSSGCVRECCGAKRGYPRQSCFHLLKKILYFPLLVLKGIYHYWTSLHIFWGCCKGTCFVQCFSPTPGHAWPSPNPRRSEAVGAWEITSSQGARVFHRAPSKPNSLRARVIWVWPMFRRPKS